MFHSIDWLILVTFFLIVLGIGLRASRLAGKNASEFFLSGRNMPWWLLGRLHGRLHLLGRHAQPGHRHRTDQRRGWQLGLVGLSLHRHAHGLRLCQALAALQGP